MKLPRYGSFAIMRVQWTQEMEVQAMVPTGEPSSWRKAEGGRWNE